MAKTTCSGRLLHVLLDDWMWYVILDLHDDDDDEDDDDDDDDDDAGETCSGVLAEFGLGKLRQVSHNAHLINARVAHFLRCDQLQV